MKTPQTHPDSLIFAATLICESCRLYETGGSENEDRAIVPTGRPREVTQSRVKFWHYGPDDGHQAEWPCQASPIWEYLAGRDA
jgi:hypothetical protein